MPEKAKTSPRRHPVLIWTYHRVLPEGGNAAVSIDGFRSQVRYLKKRGYQFIDTAELAEWFRGGLDYHGRYAMLSFDDGWADNLFHAAPVVAAENAKAVMALNTGLVNEGLDGVRKNADYHVIDSKTALGGAINGRGRESFLSWAEVRQLRGLGWDIQAHGDSHEATYDNFRAIRGFFPEAEHWSMERALGEVPFAGAPRVRPVSTLSHPRKTLAAEFKQALKNAVNDKERRKVCLSFEPMFVEIEDENDFQSRVERDLRGNADKMEKELGRRPRAFFWPWGQCSETGLRVAVANGFELAFTTTRGAAGHDTDPMLVPRIDAPDNMRKFIRRERKFSSAWRGGISRCLSLLRI